MPDPIPPIEETEAEKAERLRRQQQTGGYTNYNRYFNANKGAAQNQANQITGQIQQKTDTAANNLNTAQNQFNTNVGTGTVQAYAPPKEAPQAPTQFDESGMPVGANFDTGIDPFAAVDNSGQIAALNAQAAKGYTGPGSLLDTKGRTEAEIANINAASNSAQAAYDAQNALREKGGLQALIAQNNPGGGHSGFSANLVGTAGRGQFDKLRAQFDPQKALEAANLTSGKTAEAAGGTSTANAKTYAEQANKLQGETDTRNAELKKRRDEIKAQADARNWKTIDVPYDERSNPMYGVDYGVPGQAEEAQAKYKEFQAAMETNAGDTFRSGMESLSPVHRLFSAFGGGNDPYTSQGNNLNQQVHGGRNASGGIGQHIWWHPQDWVVYKQMTPDQWSQLDGLSMEAQGNWIEKRRHELQPGWPKGTNEGDEGQRGAGQPRRQKETTAVPQAYYDQGGG